MDTVEQLAGELAWEVAREVAGEVVWEVAGEALMRLVGKQTRALHSRVVFVPSSAPSPDLNDAVCRSLNNAVRRALNSALEEGLDPAVNKAVDDALDEVLNNALGEVLDEALHKLLDRAPMIVKDPAHRLGAELSILRVMLWVWKRSSGTQLDHSEKRRLFISSCRLWAPLETRVEFAIHGADRDVRDKRLTFDDDNRDKIFAQDYLNGIIAFVEEFQNGREKSEFIACNADVGINRLARVAFDQQEPGLE
ncbi:hypothetical protein FRC01_001718 [Tulasnella sp. 417]|nr:hypothetical protein FRC01_001718 [Tulasnella sp. 417]